MLADWFQQRSTQQRSKKERRANAMKEMRFDGRSVIVTGAGRGFGRSHAIFLATRGAKVVVVDNGTELDGSGSSPEPAQQVAKEIIAAGGEAVACFASVADGAGANCTVA